MYSYTLYINIFFCFVFPVQFKCDESFCSFFLLLLRLFISHKQNIILLKVKTLRVWIQLKCIICVMCCTLAIIEMQRWTNFSIKKSIMKYFLEGKLLRRWHGVMIISICWISEMLSLLQHRNTYYLFEMWKECVGNPNEGRTLGMIRLFFIVHVVLNTFKYLL